MYLQNKVTLRLSLLGSTSLFVPWEALPFLPVDVSETCHELLLGLESWSTCNALPLSKCFKEKVSRPVKPPCPQKQIPQVNQDTKYM